MKSHNSKIDDGKIGFLGMIYFFSLPLIFFKGPFGILVSDFIGLIIIMNLFIKRKYLINRTMSIAFLLFLIGSTMGMFQSPDITRSIKGIAQQSLVIFMLYPIMKNYVKSELTLKTVLTYYKNGVLLVSVFIVLFFWFNIDIGIVDTAFARSRTIIGDTGPNVVARLISIGALISLYFTQHNKSRKNRFKYYIEFIIMTYGVFSTASVSGLLILGFGTIWILYRYNLKKDSRNIKRLILILALAVFIGIFSYNRYDFVRYEVDRAVQRASFTFSLEEGYKLASPQNTRLSLLSGFTNDLAKHWLFGVGYSNSNYLAEKTIHFPLVAALVEVGIIGFIGVFLMYSYPIYKVYTRKKMVRWDLTSILAFLIIAGDMIQPNPNYRFTWFAILLPLVITKNLNQDYCEVKK